MKLLVLSVIFLMFSACANNDKRDENADLNYYHIKSQSKTDYIKLGLPKNFRSVKSLEIQESTVDSLSDEMYWLLDRQFKYPEHYFFFDTLNPSLNISLVSGPRVNISDKEPNVTYFSVPTIPLEKIFPSETETRKIIYDWRNKRYKNKTYFKRKYKMFENSVEYKQVVYYIITTSQSSLITVNSKDDINLDKFLLEMEVY